MKVYTYSEARQRFAELLDLAQMEEVLIKRRDGSLFSLTSKRLARSPFDVEGIACAASMQDINDAVRESRERR